MIENLYLIEYFPWIKSYLYLVAFLAPIIGGGELGVMAVAFLFSRSLQTFILIVIFSFLGMMTIDSFWFFVAKSDIYKKFKKWKRISYHYKIIEKKVERISHGKDLLIILFAKILAGTRIILMLYLGSRKIKFKRFLIYNSIPTILWAIILATLGILAAKGYTIIVDVFRDIRLGLTFLILFILVLYVLEKWVNQKLMK